MKIINLKLGSLETNCYILIQDNECIIIDPAAEFLRINLETKNLEIKAILITHYHHDHVGALNKFSNYPIFDFKNKEGKYSIGKFNFEIIETKGHKDDCVSFLFEKTMFTGDFLFKGTIGRTDFFDSNHLDMLKSLEKIKKYDKDIKIYPGHGDESTLEYEFKNNYFLR